MESAFMRCSVASAQHSSFLKADPLIALNGPFIRQTGQLARNFQFYKSYIFIKKTKTVRLSITEPHTRVNKNSSSYSSRLEQFHPLMISGKRTNNKRRLQPLLLVPLL